VQHAAERERFVAEELAAANGSNKLVASGCLSSPATQFALIRHAIPFCCTDFRTHYRVARRLEKTVASTVPCDGSLTYSQIGAGRAFRQTDSGEGGLSTENLVNLLRRVSRTSIGKIDSRIGELRTLRRRLQTDDDRIEPDIVKHAELSQQVMRLTTIISDSVKKRLRASGASR